MTCEQQAAKTDMETADLKTKCRKGSLSQGGGQMSGLKTTSAGKAAMKTPKFKSGAVARLAA
ncbi:conserved hypothetical protein, partial [Ricinus communis]